MHFDNPSSTADRHAALRDAVFVAEYLLCTDLCVDAELGAFRPCGTKIQWNRNTETLLNHKND